MGRSHKETNTYRFQNFTERMKLMHIDVVHQIRKKIEEDDGEESTYFGSALSKWVDLNCTQNFDDFKEDMQQCPCNTYVQLVHHAESIIVILKKHLMVPNTLALEPLLDLVVQMGRDLGPDFYQHFKDVFEILVHVLGACSKDPDSIEKIFTTMAFLYKFLWRYLTKNIYTVYGYFSSLLTHNKEYIQRFAAESFAFLMRKVKDQDALIQFLFADLEQNPQKTEGVGQLLFEAMKGVKEHFHTISEQVFRCVLWKLGPPLSEEVGQELPFGLVEETVRHLMTACADYSNQQKAAHLWTVLLEVTGEVHQACLAGDQTGEGAADTSAHLAHLCRLLRLAHLWLTHHKGGIVSDPPAVAKVVTAILRELKSAEAGQTLARDLLAVISGLLLHSADRLSVETTARLMSKVFSADFTLEQVKEFSWSLLNSPLFEKDVLPGMLCFLVRQFDASSPALRRDMVRVMADIVLQKSPVPEDGSHLNSLHVYTLDFGRVHRGTRNGLVQHIQRVAEQGAENCALTTDGQSLSELLSALVCLPHVSTIEVTVRARAITAAWQQLRNRLSETPQDMQDRVLYVMQKTMVSLLVLRSEVNVLDLLPAEDVLAVLKSQPSGRSIADNFCMVHATDLYLTWLSDLENDDLLTPDLLTELYPLLEPNLVSWSHKVRLSTLHLLSLFPVSIPVPMDSDSQTKDEEPWTVFTLALAAERVPLTVRDYRQRLLYLRKLDHGLVHSAMPAGPFTKMPVLYLVGTLLCPMTLLWEPVSELIASHARGLPRDVFWQSFSPWLTVATDNAVEAPADPSGATCQDTTLLDAWLAKERSSERAPDYYSFRNQLWRTMSLFPDKCEPKSRELVPLFLQFLQKEYYKTDLTMAPAQDISLEGADGKEDADHDDTVADDDEGEESTEVKGESAAGNKAPGKAQRKSAVQSLLAHLQLFAKVQNPRSLYREGELRDIFFQFLEHRHSGVQKVAFQCIMTYKYKFLTPYRENFERLMDDKTFKTEVVLFSVDEETTQVSAEHRQELLPFLMRILYGKMLSKAGNETSGKRRSDVRRSIVLRFLAGCSSSELQYFLDLVFGPFKAFVTGDPVKMVKEASSVDLKNVIPPKRMKGVLGAVLVVTEKLGSLLHDNNARSVLHLMLGVAATCAACLRQRETIKASAAAMLKSVRQMVFNKLIQFFEEFDDFHFTEEESDAILEAFVWPQLGRLTLESKCQPSLLLKLLQCWCQDPKHFHLLTKEAPEGNNSPLQAMFSLLCCGGVGRPVSAVILKAVESLLEGEEEHLEEQPPPHKRRKMVRDSAVSQGVMLVRPHVPALLSFIEDSVRTVGGQLEKNKKGTATKETILELKILARVSMYIEDEEQSVRLCLLLMPFLSGMVTLQQDLEESTLESMLNLMKTVRDPRSFFRPLAPLFISIERRQSRVLLCQILKVIGSKVPELEEIADVVEKLNAWNPRQAEEPDYKVRLDTFSQVALQLKEWTAVNVDFLLPLVYNCCFFIRSFDDLSLRDNSTFCVVTIVQRFKALTSDPALYKEVMVEVILPHVKKGLRSKQQAVRHEFLAILQALVLAFPEQPEFIGLPGLQDTDLESDFFENIKHIQVYKQAKALRRLSHYLHSHRLRADQHMGFVLPLLYAYTLDRQYAKSGKVLDAAVDLMCMMCRQLPWEYYYQLLRLYLSHLPRHLDNQRVIIRVIVSILDAFHFDLSKSQFRFSNKPKLNAQSTDAETQAEGGTNTEATTAPSGPETEKSPEESEDTAEDALVTLETVAAAEASSAEGEKEESGGGGGGGGGGVVTVEFSADRRDLCPAGLATRIHRMVLTSLIPQLHKTLTEKAKSDDVHKLAQTKYAEDEEILRVPIAMAMIKLLQKLPDGALDHKLPGIMLRVCNFLKSRAQDIRMTARDTLVKAVQSIGPRYLPFILKEMRAVLTRGYQMHVLSFSVYHLLKSITAILKPGDLDPALDDLQAIYQEELFGAVSEEKSVEGITAKLFEAKTIKGYLAYRIMAQYVSPDCLGALVHPLKTVLEGTHSQRVANKVRMALQSVTPGLLANTALTTPTLMVFIHSLTADNLPLLREPKDIPSSEPSGLPKPQKPESCLLLPKATPRGGVKPRANKKTTLDVLVEFGLVLLHSSLKNGALQSSSAEHLGFLEPLVLSLIECLSLKYVRVNSAVLRCFEWLLTFPLPTLKKKINKVAALLFVLLKNYASAGAAKGDNQELVFTCFKAVTVLVRDVKYHKLTNEHLQVLLTYCEEDIHDHTRQSTAFSVIKAILKRRLNVPELHELLSTVETMSITAEASHLKVQCREVVLQYLRDYPLGRKLEKHFAFYIHQLSYEHEAGRLSALRVLRAIFSTFDEEILQEYCGLFFLPLATCMYADGASACRELAIATIKTLLEKIDVTSRDNLFSLVLKWLAEEKVRLCSVGVQLCGLFVEVETGDFTARRQDVFPLVLDRDLSSDAESEQDQFYFLLMTLIRKVMGVLDLAKLAAWTDLHRLLEYVQSHLLHTHSWVRLLTCQIMGQVLSSAGPDLDTYLPAPKAKQLVQTLCVQLQSPLLDEELALQIMKNMATVARVYHTTSDPAGVSVTWMAKKLIKEANFESISNSQATIKRAHVFKWLAFVSQEFDAEVVGSILGSVLPALMREAENIGKEETLKKLAQEVMEWLKRKAGVEVFTKAYSQVQEKHRETKEKRKQKRAIAAVNNPEVSAAKRLKKNLKRKKPVKRDRHQKKR
ncbi:small subunit processome component 20 homolog [Babylonia areolata]|uniref:small subunit processome component 20 homolog n=1 Tax=Babylonia areolata TaxID=304850 RepID=UPI003FD4829E